MAQIIPLRSARTPEPLWRELARLVSVSFPAAEEAGQRDALRAPLAAE